MTQSQEPPPAPRDGGNHDAAPLAHHFDSLKQQYDSAKLGMWVFLITEVLFFSGLFCWYAVFRANHPDVFVDGHHFLETPLGAFNTAVLIFSSLTMALAVRSAQLGRRAPLIGLLSVTLLCGLVFLGVKTAEYRQKWHHRLVPGQARIEYFFSAKRTDGVSAPPAKEFLPEGEGQAQYRQYVRQHLAHAGEEILTEEQLQGRIANLRSFMGIYFTLTGLHALHVIIGMGVIFWILVGAIRGRFGPRRFTAVDLVGLYWHLVDLIWIYLFPLLYLIH